MRLEVLKRAFGGLGAKKTPERPAPAPGAAPPEGRGLRLRVGWADSPAEEGRPVYLDAEQLTRHVFLCGKTGTGKTVTLLNWCLWLARELIRRPDEAPGFTFIDPHGDAVSDLLARLPDEAADRVHVLHFRDTDRPRGFNLLEAPEGLKEPCIGSFVAMLRDLFPAGTGYRMEHILKNALLTLAAAPNQTILSLVPLLSSEEARSRILERVSDPVLLDFWKRQFPELAKRSGEALGPIFNKLGAFSVYPRVRRVVGQPRSTVDPMRMMDEGRVLLVDLSGAGEDVAPIMGAALVNRYHFSALSRAGRPRSERRLHVLVADEVHNYATPVMADVLSEDRKFGLGFVIA
ncbi:MAG: ATP-binding protein, partial [Firmicutes bacterium]|nr:ATP-binding protein [Bacillota bacterium]